MTQHGLLSVHDIDLIRYVFPETEPDARLWARKAVMFCATVIIPAPVYLN